ncbi:thioredoxin family protein [Accumulibacter sp.]|uniref:thioredoxin family protein n=1 Tax=Accumulibacter sp. TaxID=2053492 RepID=UPI00261FB86C|nr:thioredoxin family protein [Accumulibacter sp.]
MPAPAIYPAHELSRATLDACQEATVIEFGASWCGHCRAARPLIDEALARHPQVVHFKVEDGPGRRLGRSYQVKLWPTLLFLRQGKEMARLVRPLDASAIEQALARIATGE